MCTLTKPLLLLLESPIHDRFSSFFIVTAFTETCVCMLCSAERICLASRRKPSSACRRGVGAVAAAQQTQLPVGGLLGQQL